MKYEAPSIEIIELKDTDVITASVESEGDLGGTGGDWEIE